MKKLLAIILTLACCLSLVACATGETSPETTRGSQAQQSTKPSSSNTTQATNTPTQSTQPQQNMCYWCGKLPVGDFEVYCINCRCLKCDELRKEGGGQSLYCREHNCNESYCENPAFDDSQYCTAHKCSKPNCDNRRWPGSEYCAHHK